MSLAFIESQFQEAKKTLENFISNPKNAESIEQSAQLMVESISKGSKVISCGNGGSMSDAMHFAEELTGRYRDNRKSLPAIAISDPGYLTCAGNDFGYDFVFSRFIEGMGQKGDTLLAISTSGNSANVVNAAKTAREKGMKVVALTGKKGGELVNHCDVEVRVQHEGYADRIQEIHIKIIHCFIGLIEKALI
ncbi:D-sedoheptulose 7-phosphate isomerase [Salibacter sp.]|uniref:D-sedoheptulose 7-phosphate isomerase n=3 Tax=Salibacter sp. TaxID=2010995 RepID=UPI002870745E|nr:D-sedoheptulose 7-phosphate isomerase [Salibacter sp.]MDR9486923.1 D-sedoheptulose 7-phosphate isomerase [Salibacter sp.]